MNTEDLLNENRTGVEAKTVEETKTDAKENKEEIKNANTKASESDKSTALQKALNDTKKWGNQNNMEKLRLIKKFKALQQDGVIDKETLDETLSGMAIPDEQPLENFWPTVEAKITELSKLSKAQEFNNYYASFRKNALNMMVEDPEAFKALEDNLATLPPSEWVEIVLDEGKSHWDDFYQHLDNKPTKEVVKALKAENEKLRKQLETSKEDSTVYARPLLSGGADRNNDSNPRMFSTEDILNEHRQRGVAR